MMWNGSSSAGATLLRFSRCGTQRSYCCSPGPGCGMHEVMHLSLDDVDWANGIIHIRGAKSRRDRDLPLLRDVGRALLAYIKRERPPSSYRTIFLQALPPARPFTDSSAISRIVSRALNRAGIAPARGAAHLLRHAAATTMLTRGMSFKNIADVLGHQSLQSTDSCRSSPGADRGAIFRRVTC
ncbi:tyrosine-type recombinase/integrase [Paraburkholderia xenovorans]|uniref:tyrosine-type recombinase/integrase n=1 Tax=Paraburkholderia xenovorans TaxID=36873 RepID=UPI0038B7F521